MLCLLRLRLRFAAAALVAAGGAAAQAQGFAADYALARFTAPAEVQVHLAPALPLGGDGAAGLSLQSNRHWFGQFGLAQGPSSPLNHAGSNEIANLAGGYRWAGGQTLSLQLSRGRGPGQRLGLALNYDWPRSFVRFAYDQGLSLAPADSLHLSAGVRF